VEKINFPERLDKLDANVAGIMAAIQSVQSRLDSLERNITDRVKDVQDYQKETRNLLKSAIDQLQAKIRNTGKKQQMFSYITWFLIVIATITILFIKK
jgi:hypothetical protein